MITKSVAGCYPHNRPLALANGSLIGAIGFQQGSEFTNGVLSITLISNPQVRTVKNKTQTPIPTPTKPKPSYPKPPSIVVFRRI